MPRCVSPWHDTTDATDAAAEPPDQDADAAKTEVPAAATRCMTGGDVLYVDGDPTDPVHPGQETFAGATTTLVSAAPTTSSFSTRVWVEFVPTTPQGTGKPWELIFSTDNLSSPIGPGVYASAQRHISGAAGHPGLLITDYATSCSGALTGSFDIIELKMNGTDVTSFTATFEQRCAGTSGALRGCVHVVP